MQTFLPFPNFNQTAHHLDRQRLGKQRIEAVQILKTLRKENRGGWANHPAVQMWEGYAPALALYGYEICRVWRMKGYVDNQQPYFVEFLSGFGIDPEASQSKRAWSSAQWGNHPDIMSPPWLGDERFHLGHQAHLYRKDREFYGNLFPITLVPANAEGVPLLWPIMNHDDCTYTLETR